MKEYLIGGAAMKILFPLLFPLPFAREPLKILSGSPANLDNGIRALPRLVRAEEGQEEGAAR